MKFDDILVPKNGEETSLPRLLAPQKLQFGNALLSSLPRSHRVSFLMLRSFITYPFISGKIDIAFKLEIFE
jgi:hypothetical protein